MITRWGVTTVLFLTTGSSSPKVISRMAVSTLGIIMMTQPLSETHSVSIIGDLLFASFHGPLALLTDDIPIRS